MSDCNSQCHGVPEPTRRVLLTVTVCIDEFDIVYAEASDSQRFAITPKTPGVSVKELGLGDKVDCLVTTLLPRVMAAHLIKSESRDGPVCE